MTIIVYIEREGILMIKCPNCGSTAQVLRSPVYTVNNGEWAGINCRCGCGTFFTVHYEYKETVICKN